MEKAKLEFRLLKKDEIDCRIATVSQNGLSLLILHLHYVIINIGNSLTILAFSFGDTDSISSLDQIFCHFKLLLRVKFASGY